MLTEEQWREKLEARMQLRQAGFIEEAGTADTSAGIEEKGGRQCLA